MSAPRMTTPTRMVLRALLDAVEEGCYGAQIGRDAELPSGTVHPILARLERLGWVTSDWEDVDPVAAGRPARRYYRLTRDGAVSARMAMARSSRSSGAALPARPVADRP